MIFYCIKKRPRIKCLFTIYKTGRKRLMRYTNRSLALLAHGLLYISYQQNKMLAKTRLIMIGKPKVLMNRVAHSLGSLSSQS